MDVAVKKRVLTIEPVPPPKRAKTVDALVPTATTTAVEEAHDVTGWSIGTWAVPEAVSTASRVATGAIAVRVVTRLLARAGPLLVTRPAPRADRLAAPPAAGGGW